jgi:murein DD-endopeptidase MepM/ murein hydrolase activator NlpD
MYTYTEAQTEKKFIKWVDFSVTYEVLDQALKYDIKSHKEGEKVKLNWIELLAYAAAKNGGNFRAKRNSDIDKVVTRLKNGETMDIITAGMKYYSFYSEAYTAVLGNFVGDYWIEVDDPANPGNKKLESRYGLKVFSPIAKNYGFNHFDDFGISRSFGWRRHHEGNDLMAGVGTPIVAVEGGVIEEFGWNRFGGWRIGIRSFDNKRYYYYAHMQKNHPYHKSLSKGETVYAGQVIGYVGMTGYSNKENVNGMKRPHLHFGMQLIFDESQKDAVSQIWIDVYHIVRLLQKNTSAVVRNSETKEFNAKNKIIPKERSDEAFYLIE